MRKNQDVDWDDFSADTYRTHYFNPVGNEDWWVAQEALRFLTVITPRVGPLHRAVDIGSGPSILVPLVCAPFVKQIELIEPGLKNVSYLQSILSNPSRLRSDWRDALHKIIHEPASVSAHAQADELLCARGVARRATIADLSKDVYDLVTSIYCAESVTESRQECAALIQKVLASLKKSQPYIAAYIERSKGYPDQSFDTLSGEIDAKKFPAADIDEAWLRKQYIGTRINVKRCPFPPGMRAGYAGVLLAIGTK